MGVPRVLNLLLVGAVAMSAVSAYALVIQPPKPTVEVTPGSAQTPQVTMLQVAVLDCYDGDTCTVSMPFGAGVATWIHILFGAQQIRILGYDAPEIRGECDRERSLARRSRQALLAAIESGSKITLRNIDNRSDRYGRMLAEVWVDETNVRDILISQGLAREYDGGVRETWCAEIAGS